MTPELLVKSVGNDVILNAIVSCISKIECRAYFSDHLDWPQAEQKRIVAKFQDEVVTHLSGSIPAIAWKLEYSPTTENKDSIDIFGNGDGFVVVIELDKNRADQVAKKFVSRMAILPNTKIYYVSLCYPGTQAMSKVECVKYFGYCSALSERMGNEYAGFLIS